MPKFKNLCEDGLLGLGDYGIFEDWSAIDKSQDKYIRIRDGLVSKKGHGGEDYWPWPGRSLDMVEPTPIHG